MASLSNHLEGLNLDKKQEALGAIPKSASVGCVPGAAPASNAPSTPSSNPKNRRNRRNRQRTKQNLNNNNTISPKSSHLLQPSPSAIELSSSFSGDQRVPEIPEIPELFPLLEQNNFSKPCENFEESKEGHFTHEKNCDNLSDRSKNVDSPKAVNKKGGSRRNRRLAAGKRKKPIEEIPPAVDTRNRGKAFNEDFPHIDESDLGKFFYPKSTIVILFTIYGLDFVILIVSHIHICPFQKVILKILLLIHLTSQSIFGGMSPEMA